MSSSDKIKVRTSSLPRSLPSTTPMSSELHTQLSTALLESRSIPTIERVLTQSLAESGWTSELRAYIQKLIRSGECTNYGEILNKVMAAVKNGREGEGVVNGTGSGEGGRPVVGEGELRIPEKVVKEGIKVVKKELEKVVTVVVDD